MADNLIFPIKFDLEAAVREAQGDADRVLRRLQTTINAKPLAVNLKIPGAGSGSINEINSRLKELAKQWNSLTEAQRITNKTTGEYTAEAKKILAEYTRLRGASESYAQSLRQIDSAAKKAAKQQEKLAETAYRGSNAFKNQDGYVSRLVKRLAVYASFQYASQFLTSIREVTAEFELQRISLGAIIQDQQKANQIFAEIKSFALTSPLKILDLTKYTKQVAAYGFETEKLFDTTKMLADISVGLGVDMSRLSLFLGQVFATGYLRASEVRQATEAGIPLVDKLAKKLEELNGRAYTAAEVMDMISKRAISYELVEQVFKDMTSAGGEFYNMQVKQSQTLFGMWSKLGDAAAIMYDQIGNTSSINAGMKLAIQSIESMMRNWKTTARVLDSVAVAMTVYIVGLKNAAVASKALTSAVALENLAHQQQIIRTPKAIAGIIGVNNAKKISTLLTGLHTKAVLSEAAATNVLTKGFWKLTAAMLANPWVAAASAIALVGVALFHFIGNAETAAERAEKLNNSVASLKNLDDTTKPLIDTYNELINNTERTAEEQKKLSEVTHELAKQYPGAITAIGNFGAEVELAADKLNQLYQAEKQARMENTRNELQETEKQIASTEAQIAQLQEYLSEGKMWGGGQSDVMIAMSDEEKGRVLAQIDELRYGTDGQSGLFGLQQSADAARRALGLLPSEAAQAVEKFGAWKKTFTTFRKQVGDVRVQLFDDSTINQFGSLEEALKKTAEEYKKNIALVATYDETLKSATLTSEERAKIETERAEADAMANLAEKALKYYNAMSLLNTSTSSRSGTKSDPRLQTLQEIANKMAEVNKEYDELLKKEGQTKALADTQKLFASSFKQMEATAKKYGFKLPAFEVPQTIEDVQKWYKAIMDNIKRLNLKNADKVLIELGFKSDKAAIDKQQKDIEAELKRLSDRISRTKTAKEFYEKILEQTGDINIATRVSMSIYGSTGEELFNDTVEQIREAFKTGSEEHPIDLDISAAIDLENQRIDYKKLADIYDKYQDEIIEKRRDTANKIATEGQKEVATDILNWRKSLAKAKSYEQKRTDIINKATAERVRIIREVTDPKERGELLGLSYSKQAQDLAKNAVDEFKSSDDYIKVFQDLDRVSTQTLDRMKKRLEEMIATVKETENVEGLKTLVEQLDKIKEERETRNPIEGIIDSFKEYAQARKDYRIAESEEAAAKAEFAQQEAGLNQAIQTAKAEQAITQQRVNDLEAQGKENTSEGVAAELALNEATKKVTLAEENRNKAVKKVNNAEQKTTDALDAQKASLAKLQKNVNAMANAFSSAASSIKTIADMMGIAEDSELGDMVNGLVSGLNNAATIMTTILGIAIAIQAACWWMLGIGAAVAAFSAIGSWLSGSKIRKANKEIKRQQEILDRLEYTYSRLEKAADSLFGADYISNYNAQMKNLQAQQTAYLRMAEAERSKGKDADDAKIAEYTNAARDAADKIQDMRNELTSKFLGTDRASAAREFAESWLEAKATFASTTDAIQSKYKDMLKSMIVEGAAAKVIDNILAPMWDNMNAMLKKSNIQGAMDYLASNMDGFLQAADSGLNALWATLEARGYDMQKLLGETSDGPTGIAHDIATASEESINGLAAGINTQNFYIAQQLQEVQRIRAIVEAGLQGSSKPSDSSNLLLMQEQAMNHYAAIEANTAATVARLDSVVRMLEGVITPRGTKGARGIQVWT